MKFKRSISHHLKGRCHIEILSRNQFINNYQHRLGNFSILNKRTYHRNVRLNISKARVKIILNWVKTEQQGPIQFYIMGALGFISFVIWKQVSKNSYSRDLFKILQILAFSIYNSQFFSTGGSNIYFIHEFWHWYIHCLMSHYIHCLFKVEYRQ